jgi:D-alanyl-D-alanine endopeptidase (penicillin-binding protein 7)
MDRTRFADPTGLHSGNVSTARDLVKLVDAAAGYRAVRSMTTRPRGSVTDLRRGWKVEFFNTNRLVRRKDWTIGLSKTGYIADAGNCLVMQTNISGRPLIIVLLNSWGKLSKFGDSNRIRKWLVDAEKTARQEPSRDRSATI